MGRQFLGTSQSPCATDGTTAPSRLSEPLPTDSQVTSTLSPCTPPPHTTTLHIIDQGQLEPDEQRNFSLDKGEGMLVIGDQKPGLE